MKNRRFFNYLHSVRFLKRSGKDDDVDREMEMEEEDEEDEGEGYRVYDGGGGGGGGGVGVDNHGTPFFHSSGGGPVAPPIVVK